MSLLAVDNLSVSYGDLIAVREVSFHVEPGDCFVLLGANGAGKTSILRAISGLNKPRTGTITSEGRSLVGQTPHEIAGTGIAHVPENRRVFPHLTIEDNLSVSYLKARAPCGERAARDRVYELFPRLLERRKQLAGTLSGGEQQMLAIGRAMMNFPSVLMLDEPSLGLSPLLADTVFERLADIAKSGLTILLVEQNAIALQLANRGMVLANGRVVLSGAVEALRDSEFVRKAYLGV